MSQMTTKTRLAQRSPKMSDCIRCGKLTAGIEEYHCSFECQEADAAAGRRARWSSNPVKPEPCEARVGWCERHKRAKRCISVLGHTPGHTPVCGECRREERGAESQQSLGVVV